MAFHPIRKEHGRPRVRFEFDPERGLIRHRDRDEEEGQDYRIKARDGGRWELEPVRDGGDG